GAATIGASFVMRAIGGEADVLAIADVLKDLGIVTLTSTVVASILNDDFTASIHGWFSIVREAKVAGIVAIHRDRPAALARINQPTKHAFMQSNLKRDIVDGVRQVCALRNEGNKKGRTSFQLEFGIYTSAPAFLLVHVNDSVFIEPYHLGIPSREANRFDAHH